ncbi:MAG: 3-phosphoshikimate 1-carboxyvinyltransferase [Rhodothermales bacterium]|nr:3-phosphoshikimate 1-carboxyvinyltransferase [Rhodothermales bacterium]MBO6779638.1 3-phosphoshikimate 1-carboxyvinyltransferase [Rhodothermales bacterium]
MGKNPDIQTVRTAHGLSGRVRLPGDKSVAHRSALFAALGDGTSRIVDFPSAADPQSTLSCLRALGVEIVSDEHGIVLVDGRGRDGWKQPAEALDCGNSGTTMRLIAGLLAGRSFDTTLVGDASLQSRPMGRIADPLGLMGARIELTEGTAPMTIRGSSLTGVTYRLPVASAQVKSAVLLAGLFAHGETTVIETEPSRDHTERMLGLPVLELGGERHITTSREVVIQPATYAVPGDFSAAAFFLVAGSIVPNALVKLHGVGMNRSRTGLLDVLTAMGADIRVTGERVHGGEPLADLEVRTAALSGVSIGRGIIANLIDEIPILAVAACAADGPTSIREAGELRVKETDRIRAMVDNLRALGANVDEHEDGLTIHGPCRLRGAEVQAFHDHRIAMAMAVAGLVAEGQTTVHGAQAAAVSFPHFWDALDEIVWN